MATQGSREDQIINLDDLIVAQRLQRPATEFLLGREWTVRRDLDATEAIDFWSKAEVNDPAALVVLMGEEAEELHTKLLKLPIKVYHRVVHAILVASGLKRGDEDEGSTGE